MSNTTIEVIKSTAVFLQNIISIIISILLMLLMALFIFKLLRGDLMVKVERLTLGGFSILLENPDEILKKEMKNYINTKRTLLCIDTEKDNFSETLTSYYETYKFIRAEMEIYPFKYSAKSKIYKKSEEIIEDLNLFLTNNQNNYRRWYDYEIANNSKDDFNMDIGEIQKKYRNYEELVKGFKEMNLYFRDYTEAIGIKNLN